MTLSIRQGLFLCNISNHLTTYSIHQSKSFINELYTRIARHSFSTLVCYRKRLRVFYHCFSANPMRLGARGHCGPYHFE